jgi:DNA-binding transcriptional LysR family regulator
MRLLVEVSDCGSFSRAAQRLNVPLSTLSRRITDLERHVGTQFLTRTTRKLALTEAGRHYVEASREILEQVETAERTAAGEFSSPKGILAITSPVMFGQRFLLPVIGKFLDRYSDIRVDLALSDRNAQIVEEGFDLAVRVGVLPDSTMLAVRLGETRRIICASPAAIEKYGEPKVPEDLIDLPCVAHDFQVHATSWSFARAGGKGERRIVVNPRLSVSTAEGTVEAATSGAGFARLFSYQVADALNRGDLRLVLQQYELEPRPVSFLHSAGRAIPAKIRSFLDFAVPELRSTLLALSAPPSRLRKAHELR